MDVYMISDVQSFLDSATSTVIPSETPSDDGVEATGGQTMVTALPTILLLVLIVGVLIV